MISKLRIKSDGTRTIVLLNEEKVPLVIGVSWEQQGPHEVPMIHLKLILSEVDVVGVLAGMQDQRGRKIRRIEFEDGTELVAADNRKPVDGEPPAA